MRSDQALDLRLVEEPAATAWLEEELRVSSQRATRSQPRRHRDGKSGLLALDDARREVLSRDGAQEGLVSHLVDLEIGRNRCRELHDAMVQIGDSSLDARRHRHLVEAK